MPACLFLRQREWQRKVKIKVNWRRQMSELTKVEKLVQLRVNPQKLQNFQSSGLAALEEEKGQKNLYWLTKEKLGTCIYYLC